MFDFFLVNRVEVHEVPASNGASRGGACRQTIPPMCGRYASFLPASAMVT
jgi:hypothetical protein